MTHLTKPRVAVAAIAVTAIALGTYRPGQAQTDGPTCGVHSLRGTYVFSASGYNIVGGVPQPKAIVEVIDFNGDGTLTVPAATVSVNGLILQPGAGTGDYTVDTDCTGTIAFHGAPPGQQPPAFNIFLGPSRETAWMIQTNANTVMQGTAVRTP
jgi:hypothetical protein